MVKNRHRICQYAQLQHIRMNNVLTDASAHQLLCPIVSAYSTSTAGCKTAYRKGPDILRWSVIFRGKTYGVTIRAPLSSKDFLLVHKSRLLSILAPPSFPPYRSLKTRLLCRHLLLPSVSSSLPPTLSSGPLAPCTIFPAAVVFCTRNQVIFPATLAPGQKQPSPGSTHQ